MNPRTQFRGLGSAPAVPPHPNKLTLKPYTTCNFPYNSRLLLPSQLDMMGIIVMSRSLKLTLSRLVFPQKDSSQSGQVGVVILLLMAVILTVGLSVASRTTQDVFLSNQTSDSARVFNAAESVLDQAIAQLQQSFVSGTYTPSGTVTVGDATVNYTIAPSTIMESRIFQGNTVMINVVDPATTPAGLPAGSNRFLRVDWSKSNFDADCSVTPLQPASLLVTIYSASGANTAVRTVAVGGCNRSDGFTASNTTGATASYHFWYNIPLEAGDLFARIKPVYADTHMRVAGSNVTLPNEFFTITADARNDVGTETRKIQVGQTLPTAPSVMDYVLYSGGSLSK